MAKSKLIEVAFDKRMIKTMSKLYSTKGYLSRPSNTEELIITPQRFNSSIKNLKIKLSNFLRASSYTNKKVLEETVFCHIETGGKYIVAALKDIYTIPIKLTKDSVLISPQFKKAVIKKAGCFNSKVNVVIFDDIFDSGETFLKVSNALRELIYSDFNSAAITLNIIIATAVRRRTPDCSREDYGFSTLNTEQLPFCKLVYGERINSTKYILFPWEKPRPKPKAKRKK